MADPAAASKLSSARTPYNPLTRRHMVEERMLLTQGFENISEAGETTGFQIKFRAPYFRGVWMSVIAVIDLIVDGESFSREQLKVQYNGATYSMDELSAASTVHWEFGDPLTLLVAKPGGLEPGIHGVDLTLTLLPSHTPIIGNCRRLITLVR